MKSELKGHYCLCGKKKKITVVNYIKAVYGEIEQN